MPLTAWRAYGCSPWRRSSTSGRGPGDVRDAQAFVDAWGLTARSGKRQPTRPRESLPVFVRSPFAPQRNPDGPHASRPLGRVGRRASNLPFESRVLPQYDQMRALGGGAPITCRCGVQRNESVIGWPCRG